MQLHLQTRNQDFWISVRTVRAEHLATLVPLSKMTGSRDMVGFGTRIGRSIPYPVGMEKNK